MSRPGSFVRQLSATLGATTVCVSLLAAAPAPAPDPTPATPAVVVPDGWEVLRSDEAAQGTGLEVLELTSGALVHDWWLGTTETLIASPDGRVAVVYDHRFDSPDHARQVWLAVLRLAEEPDVALEPRPVEDMPDTLIFGAASQSLDGGETDYLVEEAHRVVGSEVLLFLFPNADVAESLPSTQMRSLLAAYREARPQDQFDLPLPGRGEMDTGRLILLGVLSLTSMVIIASGVLLWRRRET